MADDDAANSPAELLRYHRRDDQRKQPRGLGVHAAQVPARIGGAKGRREGGRSERQAIACRGEEGPTGARIGHTGQVPKAESVRCPINSARKKSPDLLDRGFFTSM